MNKIVVGQLLYRAEASGNVIYYTRHRVLSITPKGHWCDLYGKKKFILATAKKKFAYATQDEALNSLCLRRQSYIKILKKNLAAAEYELDQIKWLIQHGKLKQGRIQLFEDF